MAGEWQDICAVGAPDDSVVVVGCAAEDSAAAFLESKGLGKYAREIAEAIDAETIDDLRLIDAAILEEVVQTTGMKLISAKKFRMVIAELRGEPAMPTSPAASPIPASAHASSDVAATTSSVDIAAPDSVDVARSNLPVTAQPAEPQEYIVVCIDRSGSMGCPFTEVTLNVVKGAVAERTRMEAVKAMFYAFRDRAESVSSGTLHMGLVQFDDRVERLLELTPRLERFEAIVDDMEKRGMTAIYSAVIEAVKMLEPHFSESSSRPDLRILVLTDGQSITGAPPEEALAEVSRIGAVVDAIIVGDRPDDNLRRIVSATEGECFQIFDLGEGFQLLEAERVVSLRARRGGVEKPVFKPRPRVDLGQLSEKAITQASAVKRAPNALAPALAAKSVVSTKSIGDSTVFAKASELGGKVAKRVLHELKMVASGDAKAWMHSGDGVHIFPSPDQINFWRVLIEGPAGSPFEGGVFALAVVIPDTYPFKAPQVTFETPVYHCNVSDSGKICLDVLQDKWNWSLTVPKCLEAIRLMLQSPDTDNSLRQWIAELTIAAVKSGGADRRYYEKAHECTLQDASMSLEEWKTKWGC